MTAIYTADLITLAQIRMRSQGETIKRWANSDNILLAQTCKEIIEAAGQAPQAK